MGKRKAPAVPVWFVISAAVCFVFLSFRISAAERIPEKILRMSYVLAMPDVLPAEISQLKDHILQSLMKTAEKTQITQKSGTLNDVKTENSFSGDLALTPDDIAESTERFKKQIANGEYPEDGEVVEQTFTDNQATDSYGVVHLRNVTSAQSVSLEDIILKGCSLPVCDISEPTVLIYHTHSTECYIMNDNGRFSSSYSSRNDDKNINMVRVGDEIAKILEYNGIGVIHDRNIYDSVYTGAYGKSREGIEKNLQKYPSIIITLDIHRDAVYYNSTTRMKPVTEIDGVKAAQMMIITGAEGGNVSDFPSWQTNLSFAVMLQKAANEKYENLMKPIYFCNRKYNMDVTPYSLLIEIGTDVNTLSEAAYSGRLLGDVLSSFIKENAVKE